jgi:catechol 2,3-dioxygenase-like lactoylglutathione lyase family enzyme
VISEFGLAVARIPRAQRGLCSRSDNAHHEIRAHIGVFIGLQPGGDDPPEALGQHLRVSNHTTEHIRIRLAELEPHPRIGSRVLVEIAREQDRLAKSFKRRRLAIVLLHVGADDCLPSASVGKQHVVFLREVPEECSARDSCGLGDLIDGHRSIAALGEQAEGDVLDPLPPDLDCGWREAGRRVLHLVPPCSYDAAVWTSARLTNVTAQRIGRPATEGDRRTGPVGTQPTAIIGAPTSRGCRSSVCLSCVFSHAAAVDDVKGAKVTISPDVHQGAVSTGPLDPVQTRPEDVPRECAIGGVNHIVLYCKDLDRTVRFYQDLLGMEAVYTVDHRDFTSIAGDIGADPRWTRTYFFHFPGNPAIIAFFELPSLPENSAAPSITAELWDDPSGPAHPTKMDHLALDAPSRESLVYWQQRLRSHGVKVSEIVEREETKLVKSIYFKDPDGLDLELATWNRQDPAWRDAGPEYRFLDKTPVPSLRPRPTS